MKLRYRVGLVGVLLLAGCSSPAAPEREVIGALAVVSGGWGMQYRQDTVRFGLTQGASAGTVTGTGRWGEMLIAVNGTVSDAGVSLRITASSAPSVAATSPGAVTFTGTMSEDGASMRGRLVGERVPTVAVELARTP